MKIVAIIPARSGSKGLPGKNVKLLMGRPLIEWTIAQALESRLITSVLVSTDSRDIADLASRAGALVPALRPEAISTDQTPTEEVLIHAIHSWCSMADDDLIVLLQPTSPVRLPSSIDDAISLLIREQADSLVSVCTSHAFYWRDPIKPKALYDFQNRPRRQDIPAQDLKFRENGSIYIVKAHILRSQRNRLGGKIAMFVMNEIESWEIDSEADFTVVESLMRSLKNGYR